MTKNLKTKYLYYKYFIFGINQLDIISFMDKLQASF